MEKRMGRRFEEGVEEGDEGVEEGVEEGDEGVEEGEGGEDESNCACTHTA
jgi:hypothetical protein